VVSSASSRNDAPKLGKAISREPSRSVQQIEIETGPSGPLRNTSTRTKTTRIDTDAMQVVREVADWEAVMEGLQYACSLQVFPLDGTLADPTQLQINCSTPSF